ncbi:hypothetical protein FG379_000390 [Cryptosporidium bovis]|uniref:uncharacterized protein n=1 Tax=Cryptosporidium bovis TaxID=310047 RepID=UPI003519FEAE|nr:hypothetical protein FG379_000390 [Cryptosporidium bovis]
MFSMRSGIVFLLGSICYLIFLSGVNAITKEEIWSSLQQLTSVNGPAECRKTVMDIKGNCPDIVLRTAKNKNEIFDICLGFLSKIVEECAQPSFQAGYTFFESGGSSVRLVGGTKSVSRSEIKKILTRFCQVVARNLEHRLTELKPPSKLTPGISQPPYPLVHPGPSTPPYPTVPYPTIGFQFPTGPTLPPIPTSPPSGPTSPHSEEWKKLVASALLGTASKYVSRIPTVPHPLYMVGRNDEEKKVNCIKALRNMVENSEKTGERKFLGDKMVYTVTSLTESKVQLREELIIVINKDDPMLVKEMIKKFCDESYGGKPVTEKHGEWNKLHRASLSSAVVQNLPSEPPIFFEFEEITGLGLMEACNKVIKQLVLSARSRDHQRISSGKYTVSVSLAGSYVNLDGFKSEYNIRVHCKGQGTEQELTESVAKFCRGIYKRPGGGEKGKEKQRLLDALYSHIQRSTAFGSPFRGFPVQSPYFLNKDSYILRLDSNGDTTLENKIQVCTKFLVDCSQRSERTDVIEIKYGFSGSYQQTYEGVLKGQHLKMYLEWGPPAGKVALEFPMLDLRNFPGYTLEKVARDFCSKIMSTFTFSIKATTPYSPGPYQHPSPSPPPPSPPPPPPPPSVPLPIPSIPSPVPSVPSPIQTPYPVGQYKYIGKRPPIGYPQSLTEKLYVQVQVTQSVIAHSNDIWLKLCQYSSFGFGSDKIRGLSGPRPTSFIAPGPRIALEQACYNLFASIYNFASSYRLSSDESTLEVSRSIAVDGSAQGQATSIGTLNLVFYLSRAPRNLPYGASVSALIEMFCENFADSSQ